MDKYLPFSFNEELLRIMISGCLVSFRAPSPTAAQKPNNCGSIYSFLLDMEIQLEECESGTVKIPIFCWESQCNFLQWGYPSFSTDKESWHRAARDGKQFQRAQELPLQPPDAFSQGHKHSITPCCTFVNVIPTPSAC